MKTAQSLIDIYNILRPIIDVGLLSFILYKAYAFIVKTNSIQVVKAAVIVILVYAMSLLLRLQMVVWIFNTVAPVLFIAFAIVFQPELRKIFLRLGQNDWFAFGNKTKHTYVDSVLIAADMLSKQRRGMLAVFIRHTPVDDFMASGTRLDAKLSSSLLVTIYGKDTPLHDGACFIQDGKILAAGCFLPSTEKQDIQKTFGSRHRAAIGLSEETDCVVLVVSEETGAISLAYDSNLHYNLSQDEIAKILENLLEITRDQYNIEDTIDEHTSKA